MLIMKKLRIIFMLAMLSLAGCHLESEKKNVNWQSDYAAALKTAATEKKNILIIFTWSSDWDQTYQALEQHVLSNPAFKEYANRNLITVLVDSNDSKLTEAQIKANEALSKQFDIENFPAILMLDSNGNLLQEINYRGQTPDDFITELNRSRMMVPRRCPVPPLEGKRASKEVIKFYDSITFPPKGKSSDHLNYLRKNFDFYKLQLVTMPLKSSAINQHTADWITAVLKNYFLQPDSLTPAELEKSGREIYLKDGDAASPYFLACYLLTNPPQEIKAKTRASLEKFFANKKLPVSIHIIYSSTTGGTVLPSLEHAISNGELEQAPPQFIYRLLTENGNNAIGLPQILSLLEKSKIDPWVAKMIAGKIELAIAWKARGGGYADTVTPEGWNGFNENGKLAYKYFENAWKMHPEWPEAAGELVYVACGQGGLDDMAKWFNRAIYAQVDYQFAYQHLLWGLRPRWHGNWHMMLAFGQKAAEMDDSWYYTTAPMAFLWAVNDIASEMDPAQRRAFLREQAPNVRRVMEKVIAARMKNHLDNLDIPLMLVKYLLQCGDYAEAKTALANAQPNDNNYYAIGLQIINYFNSVSMDNANMQIALATGAHAEIIRQVDLYSDAGNKEKAAQLYISLLPKLTNPSERIFVEDCIEQIFLSDRHYYYSVEDHGIFTLARYGSIPGVQAFLDAKYDVNIRGPYGCTLLQRSLFEDSYLDQRPEEYAASKIAMLKFLLSRGADIHALAGPKWTAQHLAVSSKLPVQVLEFIAQQPGIDLNAGDVDMETPLIWCAMLDLPEHAKFLIKHGVDINRRDKSGKTALDHAHSDTIRQLLLDAVKPH